LTFQLIKIRCNPVELEAHKDPVRRCVVLLKLKCIFCVGHHKMRINNMTVKTVKVKYVEPMQWNWLKIFTKRVVQPVPEPCIWEEAFPWP